MYRTGLTYLFERPHFEHSEFGTPQCYTILYITVLERGSIYIIYRLSILKSGGHSGTEREAQRVPKRHDRAGRPGDPPARCSGRRSGVRKKVFCPIYIYIYLFHRWKYSPNYTYMVGVCRRSFFPFCRSVCCVSYTCVWTWFPTFVEVQPLGSRGLSDV